MNRLSKAQERALKWLEERGGSGAVDRWGRVLAAGETCKTTPETWLRLVAAGRVEGFAGRLRILEPVG